MLRMSLVFVVLLAVTSTTLSAEVADPPWTWPPDTPEPPITWPPAPTPPPATRPPITWPPAPVTPAPPPPTPAPPTTRPPITWPPAPTPAPPTPTPPPTTRPPITWPPAPTPAPPTPAPPVTPIPPTPPPPTLPPPTNAPTPTPTQPHSGHQFTIINDCVENIWLASTPNPGFSVPFNGGILMARSGPPLIVDIPVGWQGRFWARAGCNFTLNNNTTCNPPYQPCCSSGSCLQADGTFGLYCAGSGLGPSSLLEITLDAPSPNGPYDVYDVSLVDGWSVPLSITPVNGTFNPFPDPGVIAPWCLLSGCNDAPLCPPAFVVPGTSLSCWSPCQGAVRANISNKAQIKSCCVCTMADPGCNCATTTDPSSDRYGCCTGGFGCTPYHTPAYPKSTQCNPWDAGDRAWTPQDLSYIQTVRQACPQSYSWQFDDTVATFNCRKTQGLVDYRITFTTRFRGEQPTMEQP